MKERFLDIYEIESMSRASLVLRNKRTNHEVYIHRNVFNNLAEATDFREVTVQLPGGKLSKWIEILIWKSLLEVSISVKLAI